MPGFDSRVTDRTMICERVYQVHIKRYESGDCVVDTRRSVKITGVFLYKEIKGASPFTSS